MTTTTSREVNLAARYELRDGEIYLSGLQALVRIPIDQSRLDRRNGLNTATLVSGYEGSPLAGFDLEIVRQKTLMEQHGVLHRPGVNEELAANAVQGSQLASAHPDALHDGVVGIWYGKAPGLDRATDALRHANLGGADSGGGVLVLVGDDSIAKSSTVPSSSETAMSEIGMTVLSPSDPQDVLDLGLHGIALSRFCGLWTGFKLATNVVDGAATAVVRVDQVEPVIPDRTIEGTPYEHEVSADFLQPTLAGLERSLVTSRIELARRYAYANQLNRVSGDTEAHVGVVAAGATYLDVLQALRMIGITEADISSSGVRILKYGMISPLEPRILEEFAAGLNEIIVVEEKRPFLELALKDALYGRKDAPAIFGKRGPSGAELLRADADLPPEIIATVIASRLAAYDQTGLGAKWLTGSSTLEPVRGLLPLVSRNAFFCSGCPHNRSTETPTGSLVGAGIGCSALAAFMPESRVGDIVGLSQMGGEGGAWVGMEPFVTHDHLVQNMGDGTFHHSGSLAVRGAVAARANITFKILYNDTVAMTGGQRAVGKMAVPELVQELLAEGVGRVVITTEDLKRYKGIKLPKGVQVRHRDRLIETQTELAELGGVTVLIHDQECATELRRKRKRSRGLEPKERAFINERICEGCGDCGVKSNCLSVQPVETEYGRKTRIHQASCNKDFSCLDGDCPSFLTVVPGSVERRDPEELSETDLPEPEVKVGIDEFNLRVTGIGGTGVVTTAQIISTAATMAGLYVRSLDQMGMAQKGGAVVSDIRLSTSPIAGANKVTSGECDLYLVCDLLVGANSSNLAVTSPKRTIAVVSTSAVPTGAMVTSTTESYPDIRQTVERIATRTRDADNAAADVRELVLALFGDDQYANIFQVGMAVQVGGLPLSAAVIEDAITLNGVAVDRNIQAFRRGRQLVAEPTALISRLRADRPAESAPSEAARVVASKIDLHDEALAQVALARIDELIAYQDIAYAQVYAETIRRVQERSKHIGVASQPIVLSVARNLYKLMAYKDEYEVARLSIDPQLQRRLEAEFGVDAKYSYRLHPPVLRALGFDKKVVFGSWFGVVLRALYAMRGMRRSRLNPFGIGKLRSVERELVGEYVSAVETALGYLNSHNSGAVARLAELPDVVRGYEEVKLKNVANYRAEVCSLLSQLETASSSS